ncbi:MAG: hypothetical protein WCP85_30980 [Mariniphaga sp.]
MKQSIYILLFFILGLFGNRANAQNNFRIIISAESKAEFVTFSNLITYYSLLEQFQEGSTAIQLSAYDCDASSSLTKSLIIDLAGFNLANPSGYSCTLSDTKWFALKNSTGSGVFSGKIKFGGTGAILKVYSSNVLGSGFSIDGDGASGKIEIGDGTTPVTQSINSSQCNGKVSLFTVTSNATLIVSM